MDALERRKYIIDSIEAGRKQYELAEELGVTRQAISLTYRRYRKGGDAFMKTPGKKGRKKEKDSLTVEEKKQAMAWLKEHTPGDCGHTDEDWSLYSVKRAVVHLFDKRINLEKAHELFYGAGLKPSGRPYRPDLYGDDAVDSDTPRDVPISVADTDLPSLEEMERINRETWENIPWEKPLAPPLERKKRTGKHAKGNFSPTQKKRRRRKK